jgi:hypothetical protein
MGTEGKEGVGLGNGREGKIEGWVQEREGTGGPLLQILEVWACHSKKRLALTLPVLNPNAKP